VRIVNLLAGSDDPVCLCNLTEPLGLAQATVSAHLRKLVDAGLVRREARGKWSFFSIDSQAFERVAALARSTGRSVLLMATTADELREEVRAALRGVCACRDGSDGVRKR